MQTLQRRIGFTTKGSGEEYAVRRVCAGGGGSSAGVTAQPMEATASIRRRHGAPTPCAMPALRDASACSELIRGPSYVSTCCAAVARHGWVMYQFARTASCLGSRPGEHWPHVAAQYVDPGLVDGGPILHKNAARISRVRVPAPIRVA